jgi:hypothetical protein
MTRKTTFYLIMLLMIVFLAACATPVDMTDCVNEAPKGFLWGLLHGFISPFTFIVSLFKDSVAIYECNNNGGWYDFGFLLGASIFFGGSGSKARKRR